MNRIISVLIADDEEIVREGLRDVVEWRKAGFEICDEAADGEDTIEKIRLYNPGLVLIDIRMPGCSGLEVIRRSREQGYSGEFVILSGFSDFEYVRTGLNYGVSDYILKPVDPAELMDILKKTGDRIREKIDRNRSQNQYMRFARELVIYHMLTGKNRDGMDYGSLDLLAPVYQAVIYESFSEYYKPADLASMLGNDEKAASMFETASIRQREVILLKGKESIDRFRKLLAHFENGIQKNSPMDSIFCVYGKPVYRPEDVHESYEQCEKLMGRRFFCDLTDHVLSYEDLPSSEPVSLGREVSIRYAEEIDACLLSFNRRKLSDVFWNLRRELTEGTCDAMAARHFLIDVFLQVKHRMLESLGKEAQSVLPGNIELIETVEGAGSLNAALGYLREQCEKLIAETGTGSRESIFEDIRHYIDTSYSSRITLDLLSGLFGYNSAYLGRLFPQITGYSFNAYLEKVRIEKAEQLLQTTDLKIYEIAERVGYKYTDVFQQKFKRLTGISPSEYRKVHFRDGGHAEPAAF